MSGFASIVPGGGSSGGGTPTIAIPEGLSGGGVFDVLQTVIDDIEAVGSKRSLAVAIGGDSKAEGHRIRVFPDDAWSEFLAALLGEKIHPGGVRKHTEWMRLATYTESTRLDGARLANDVVMSAGGVGDGVGLAQIASGGTLSIWIPDGATAVSLVLDSNGSNHTGIRVDVYTGNRTGVGPGAVAVPGAGVAADLASFDFSMNQYVADWKTTEYHDGRLHVDAAGVPFYTNRRVYIPVAQAMPLENQASGCTVVVRAISNVNQSVQWAYALFTQRGGDPQNFVAVMNVAEHSSRADAYFDATPVTTYAPSKTMGGDKRMVDFYRNWAPFQHHGWAPITHAATDLLILFCRYTNDLPALTSNALIDAFVANLRAIRDEAVALGAMWIFPFLPVTVNQVGALWDRFKAGVKAMCEEHARSGWIDTQIVTGLTRVELVQNYAALGYGADGLHEGRLMNLVTATLIARPILRLRWAR